MYKTIQKFFSLYHHLALPGIGSFSVETIPAQIDFANRNITSSNKKIVFNNDQPPAEKKFFSFVSKELKIDELQAVRRFTDFTTQLQSQLNNNQSVNFKGIGVLTRQTSHVINFQPEELPLFYPDIVAERIIRKNVSHTVRVGEDEKTSEEMQDVIHQSKTKKKDRWWIAAIILAAVGIAAISIYYATHR